MLPPDVLARENSHDLWTGRLNEFFSPFRVHLSIERLQVATGWGSPRYGLLTSTREFPKDFRRELLYLRRQSKFRDAVASEGKAFDESIKEVRAAGTLGDRPLVVLTADRPYEPDPILTNEQMDAQNNLWIHELQVQEAHLSTRGKQIIVSNTSHMIPFDRPDAIVDAIRSVYGESKPGALR
jgi:hypothetical protein